MYKLDSNIVIKGEIRDGLKLLAGIVQYDFVLIDTVDLERNDMPLFNFNDGVGDITKILGYVNRLLFSNGAVGVKVSRNDYTFIREQLNNIFGENNYVTSIISNNSSNKNFNEIEYFLIYQKSDAFYYKQNKGQYFRNEKLLDLNNTKSSQLCEVISECTRTDKSPLYGEVERKILSTFTKEDSKVIKIGSNGDFFAEVLMELNLKDNGERTCAIFLPLENKGLFSVQRGIHNIFNYYQKPFEIISLQ